MQDTARRQRRAKLNKQLEHLKEQLEVTPVAVRDEIVEEIEEVQSKLEDLAVDERNRTSMEGGSEA